MDYIFFEDEQITHPLYQKKIVFTGALTTMTRSEAAKSVRPYKAVIQGAVTIDTDFVILGAKRRGISSKHQKAQQLIALGHPVQILEEDDFLWLLTMK